jgi:hypothetical protein
MTIDIVPLNSWKNIENPITFLSLSFAGTIELKPKTNIIYGQEHNEVNSNKIPSLYIDRYHIMR